VTRLWASRVSILLLLSFADRTSNRSSTSCGAGPASQCLPNVRDDTFQILAVWCKRDNNTQEAHEPLVTSAGGMITEIRTCEVPGGIWGRS
jgi:hypothetical protein